MHLKINLSKYEMGELFAQLSSSGVSAEKSVKFRKKILLYLGPNSRC